MAMMARKALLTCGAAALLGGGMAGIGLANYAQSGAFDFYKQTPPPIERASASLADSAGYYPVRPAAPPAYPENPVPARPLAIARPAEAADYQRAARMADDAPPAIEAAALPEAEAPAITPARGSWSEPGDSPAPAEPVAGDIAS